MTEKSAANIIMFQKYRIGNIDFNYCSPTYQAFERLQEFPHKFPYWSGVVKILCGKYEKIIHGVRPEWIKVYPYNG